MSWLIIWPWLICFSVTNEINLGLFLNWAMHIHFILMFLLLRLCNKCTLLNDQCFVVYFNYSGKCNEGHSKGIRCSSVGCCLDSTQKKKKSACYSLCNCQPFFCHLSNFSTHSLSVLFLINAQIIEIQIDIICA